MNDTQQQCRTKEQFEEIIDLATNGNWSDAVQKVEEFGFYANDLVNAYDEMLDELGVDELQYFKAKDLIFLIPDKRTD